MSSSGDFGRLAGGALLGPVGFFGALAANRRQAKKGEKTLARDVAKSEQDAATAERVSADEDLRRQRLFQNPVQDEEEIISKRKQLLGQ